MTCGLLVQKIIIINLVQDIKLKMHKCTLKEFTRFLRFQLQKLLRKTYRAKVSTADSLYMYVVEGKITLAAVVQKSF